MPQPPLRPTHGILNAGLQLDMIARRALWSDGLEYGHGTGHGIGAYLNVHEGPMGIGGGSVAGEKIQKSERMRRVYLCGMQPGMVVSNEPGFYKPGAFGIRIESDLVCVEAKTRYGFGARPWLAFETLSMVPISKRLVQADLLTREEVAWLDAYHAKVYDAIKPQLDGSTHAGVEGEGDVDYQAWLWEATRPLGE